MAYSHGKQWNEQDIENGIFEVISILDIDGYMPSTRDITKVTHNFALSNAISKRGGFHFWANKLGLKMKNSETKFGKTYEEECFSTLISFGYDCQYTSIRYPYDILANNVKIDVKSGSLYFGVGGKYFTFNLEKPKPTCDVYICYCIENSEVKKIYVIPSCVVSGKTQLSLGVKCSKYDRFVDKWEIIKEYDDFYNTILKKYKE